MGILIMWKVFFGDSNSKYQKLVMFDNKRWIARGQPKLE